MTTLITWKEDFATECFTDFLRNFCSFRLYMGKPGISCPLVLMKDERMLESSITCKMFFVIWIFVRKIPVFSILHYDYQFAA